MLVKPNIQRLRVVAAAASRFVQFQDEPHRLPRHGLTGIKWKYPDAASVHGDHHRSGSMNKATERTGVPSGIGAVCDAQASSLDALTQAYTLWIGNAARIHAEFMRFVGERFQKDAETLVEFAACRSPAEVMQLQFELASSIPADYFVESQKLLALLDRVRTQSAQQVT